MSIVVFVGVAAYGAYALYKKNKKIKSKTQQKTPDTMGNSDLLAEAICQSNTEWLKMVDLVEKTELANNQMGVQFLINLNALVYEKHGISSGGFFVTEKNLKNALVNLDMTHLCISPELKSFIIGSDNGAVLYFKNEFYEDEQTGNTECVYVTLHDILSPVAGIGYVSAFEMFVIGYKNSQVRIFQVTDSKSIGLSQSFSLGNQPIIHFSSARMSPIFATLDEAYQLNLWQLEENETVTCVESEPLQHFFAQNYKQYATAILYHDKEEQLVGFFFAINNISDKKMEIYAKITTNYECMLSIDYQGEITCSTFSIDQRLFAFYEQDGDKQGVHIWNIDLKKEIALFGPDIKEAQEQHPIQIYINDDKIFCLYKDGILDMWHCDVDRTKTAQECLEKIVERLPKKLRIEFLKQFGIFMGHRTPENYNLVVKLGSKGMNETEIQAELLRLQFLPPDVLEQINAELKKQK